MNLHSQTGYSARARVRKKTLLRTAGAQSRAAGDADRSDGARRGGRAPLVHPAAQAGQQRASVIGNS